VSLRQSLKEGWAILQSQASIPGRFRACPLESARLGVRAIISESGHLGLLVPLAQDERFKPAPVLRPGGGGTIEAEVATFTEGAESIHALAVTCLDPALADAFVAFCESLLERSAAGVPVARALEICLSEFRQLLAFAAPIDVRTLVGLLGELLVLADLVAVSPSAVATWGGKDKERHDFRAGPVAIEVKTSLRSGAANLRVHISALDQLQPPAHGHLFLHAVRLERAASGDVSVPALLTQIEARLEGAELEQFRASLQLGDEIRRDTRAFSLLARCSYEVRENFPCLTPAKLLAGRPDEGVGNIEYDLDLGCAQDFVVTNSTAFDALLAHGRAA
jgi:hypothetical protein